MQTQQEPVNKLHNYENLFLQTIAKIYDPHTEFFENEENLEITAICTAKMEGQTGVEMQALTGVNVALLTIYDMCKAIDKSMELTDIHLVEKSGGKSGLYRNPKE